MDKITHRLRAWDGPDLVVHEWDGRGGTISDHVPPLLCLPGLVRTGLDFEALAPLIGAGRRMVAVDYPGRGASGRSDDAGRYGPEACIRDVLDICAALHLHQAIAIGTSFGGLLAMGLAAARPSLIRAVVLNDVGPDIGSAGTDFVRGFVALDPGFPDVQAAAKWLRAKLPPLSLSTEADWRRMAELTYAPGPDGKWHPLWDTRIATLLDEPARDLWPLFGALDNVPLLLVQGALSNILLPETVARMQARRPDMTVVVLPDVGHAPVMTEPPILAALQGFLATTA
jgi:pimeloyl-ACP methyl ester carboxylesterase